jgi:hypothetical protein
MAFMDTPRASRLDCFASFMPDLKPGYNPIPLFLAARRSNLRHCERSEAIQLCRNKQAGLLRRLRSSQ